MVDMIVDRLCSLLQNLSTTDGIYPNLLSLKTELDALSDDQLRYIVTGVNLSPLFQCLALPEPEQVDTCCMILERLLPAVCDSTMLINYSNELRIGLEHPNTNVQHLCLNVLRRLSQTSEHQRLLYRGSCDFTVKLIQLLGSPDLHMAELASKILIAIGSDEEGLDVMYSGASLASLQNITQLKNDTIRYRGLTLILAISCVSSAALARTSHAGLLESLLSDLHKNDVLVQLNAIQLLTDLALTPHGLDYLEREGVVAILMQALHAARHDPMSALIVPGLVKFFGNVSRLHPKEVFTKYPYFVDVLLEEIASRDATLCGLVVDTIGFIGTSPEGKVALSKLGNKMEVCLRGLSRLLFDSPAQLRVKALHTVASLLTLQVCDQSSDLLLLTQHWFSALGPMTLQHLVSVCHQPFSDLRAATHSVFASLALQPWGQKLMLDYPGFREYLLDRSTETDKSGKEGKYEIVKTLVESPTIGSCVEMPYLMKLREIFIEGPFHVPGQAEVALQRDS